MRVQVDTKNTIDEAYLSGAGGLGRLELYWTS